MGALGRIYASALSGPVEVRGMARTEEHAAALGRGLTVRRAAGEQSMSLTCYPRDDDGWRADLGILLTKAGDTPAAVRAAARHLAESAPVLTLQNGLGNREAIARELGEPRAGWGVSYVSGTAIGPALSELVNPGETVFGLPATTTAVLDAVVDALNQAGLSARVSEDAERLIWAKVVMAGAMNATGALSGVEVGEYWADRRWHDFLCAMVEEAAAVARAEGVAVDAAAVLEGVAGIAARAPGTVPSMLQDVRRQRRTEIDAMAGELVRRAERHQLATPTLAEAVKRVHEMEAAWR